MWAAPFFKNINPTYLFLCCCTLLLTVSGLTFASIGFYFQNLLALQSAVLKSNPLDFCGDI